MKAFVIRFIVAASPAVDAALFIFVWPSAFLLKMVRKYGVDRLPLVRHALLTVGVFPIRNHYYEPKFDYRDGGYQAGARNLPGVDWNVESQITLMRKLDYAQEFVELQESGHINVNNGAFESGDAEVWYQIVRHFKPKRIIEVGCGQSTLIAREALIKNQSEEGIGCEHICIEPYEQPWLDSLAVSLVRKKVEDIGVEFFESLESGDVLFIDSSHVLRPQGDVAFEYLQLLPSLCPGVIVHLHDIFSPRDYPADWVADKVRMWNEQYVFEAFISNNSEWTILAALNFLHHEHFDALKMVAPYLTESREPGSMYLIKN